MVLRHLVGWLRAEIDPEQPRGHWARWIGRNWARLTYAKRVEPTWLELNQCEIPVRGLPTSFDGFRIVQLSDFHCSHRVTPSYLAEAVTLAQRQDADLAVLTGDFIHRGFSHVEDAAAALSQLTAPCGVYAVLGNHDYSVRNALGIRRFPHLHRAVAEALTVRGIRVLHNEAIKLERGIDRIALVGVADLWSRACDLNAAFGLVENLPCIVLAHNPRTVERLEGHHRCDLMLSGHTHGGQVNLPGLGRVTLGKRARRLAAGLYRVRNSYVYVNKGIGFGFQIRYGVRPEVAVLTLRTAS